jgi:hypothetical protein
LVGVTDFSVFEVRDFHVAKLGFKRKARKVFSQSTQGLFYHKLVIPEEFHKEMIFCMTSLR